MPKHRKSKTISRKRQRELHRLRAQAEELLEHQRDVLGHAGLVAQEAGRQVKHLNAELVMPRVNEVIETTRPTVDRGVAAARRTADRVRVATAPLVATALLGTVRSLERLENQDAAKQLRHFGEERGLIAPAKKKGGFGRFVAIALGAAAAIGVGYALWQAFRDDDDLWVAPAEDTIS